MQDGRQSRFEILGMNNEETVSELDLGFFFLPEEEFGFDLRGLVVGRGWAKGREKGRAANCGVWNEVSGFINMLGIIKQHSTVQFGAHLSAHGFLQDFFFDSDSGFLFLASE